MNASYNLGIFEAGITTIAIGVGIGTSAANRRDRLYPDACRAGQARTNLRLCLYDREVAALAEVDDSPRRQLPEHEVDFAAWRPVFYQLHEQR